MGVQLKGSVGKGDNPGMRDGGVGHDVIDNCMMYPFCTFCHRKKLY